MKHHLALALLFGSSLACTADLDVPDGAFIRCADDQGCPTGLICATAAARCVDESLRETAGPRLQSATAIDAGTVRVVFDEEIIVSADAASTTVIVPTVDVAPPLAVSGVERSPDDVTQLHVRTEAQRGERDYDIDVAGLTDVFGNPLAPADGHGQFRGIGVLPDRTPPSFVSPDEGEQFHTGSVALEWTIAALVESYEIEVWTVDPTLPGGTRTGLVTVPATTTRTTINLTSPTSHWLRLRSDATRPGEWAVRRIEVVGDTLYVHCSADSLCDDEGTGGNQINPRRSVTQALADVRRLELQGVMVDGWRLLIAARGNDNAYDESVDVFAGITLRGGYDDTFAEAAWDPVAHRTILRTSQATVLRGSSIDTNLDTPDPRRVLIEGLEFISESADPSSVMTFVNCDNGVELRGNILRNLGSNVSRIGVFMQSSDPKGADGPRILDNEIWSGLGVQTIGVNALIQNNILRTGGIPEGGGVFVTGGDVTISNNDIDVATFSEGGFVAVYVLQLNPFDGRVDVLDNTISVASAPRSSVGIIVVNGDANVQRNAVTVGESPFSVGLFVESNERIADPPTWTVTDNVIEAGMAVTTYGTSAGIYVIDRGDPISGRFEGNRGRVLGLGANSGFALGVYVGSEGSRTPATNLAFNNNAFSVGCAVGALGCTVNGYRAGAWVYTLGSQPQIAFTHNTLLFSDPSTLPATGNSFPTASGIYVVGATSSANSDLAMTFVNNLIVGPGSGAGIYSDEAVRSDFGPVIANTLAVGVEAYAVYFGLTYATGADANGAGVNPALGAGNAGMESTALDEVTDTALDTLDGLTGLRPTAASPLELRRLGQLVPAVPGDLTGAVRTCPTPLSDCTSIGAFELD